MSHTYARRRVMALAALGAASAAATLAGCSKAEPKPKPTAATTSASSSPTATPLRPADTQTYDLGALPAAEVYQVIPALSVDPAPQAPALGTVAIPKVDAVPVFRDAGGAPVAQLIKEQQYGGTQVPAIAYDGPNWIQVMLSGRAGLPSAGVKGQMVGWVRVADVELLSNAFAISIDLASHTLKISKAGQETYSTSQIAWGTDKTRTPLGRSFVMLSYVDPSDGYTKDNVITALGVQSEDMDGFDGHSIAVTAIHYKDEHEGAISNGCVRVDAETTKRLAEVPLGTVVTIT